MLPHKNKGTQKRFLLSISLTSLILAAEVIGGLWTGSLALLSDAAHVFMDIFALGLSYLALRLSALPSDDRHSYGYHRLEVLAALINGASLVAIAIGIFVEAVRRFQTPEPVKSIEMLVIAVIGLLANLGVIFILGHDDHAHEHEHGEAHAHEQDLNVRSAFLHVVGDAVSSLGVIVAAVLMALTGWLWIDPIMSIFIGLLILFSSARVLKSSLHILIEGVPEGIALEKVDETIRTAPGVSDLHDLHVWNICSGHVALSAHVVMCQEKNFDQGKLMTDLKQRLSNGFAIEHTTIQFETAACGGGGGQSNCRCN
ncbi:MAG TPA: cation diffusion facilitator family transporter [Anaerolineaceae bacterium]|nr:cation diffusion facilitator family transporter [Anaerolineaceae bacterium]